MVAVPLRAKPLQDKPPHYRNLFELCVLAEYESQELLHVNVGPVIAAEMRVVADRLTNVIETLPRPR